MTGFSASIHHMRRARWEIELRFDGLPVLRLFGASREKAVAAVLRALCPSPAYMMRPEFQAQALAWLADQLTKGETDHATPHD